MVHHAKFPLLATGSADHCVRIWDTDRGCCTHNLKGIHGGIISALAFHPNAAIMQLVSGGEDGSLALWDLNEARPVYAFPKSSHVSAVTAVAISGDGRFLLSAGRDQIVNIWTLAVTGKPLVTLPVMEAIESAGWIEAGRMVEGGKQRGNKGVPASLLFYTAGEKGIIRLWSLEGSTCKLVVSSAPLSDAGHGITQVRHVPGPEGGELLAITSDLLLAFLPVTLSSLHRSRLMIGHQGEVTDAIMFGDRLVLSSNAPELRSYASPTQLTSLDDHTCLLWRGGDGTPNHKEAVIALAASEKYLISGSRDHTAIVWDTQGSPLTQLVGHTDAVSAVSATNAGARVPLVATASADLTLKLWDLETTSKPTLRWTVKAHEKDINCVAFTPNNKLLLTASQDKTIKVWQVSDGKLVRTFKGHRRGVWSLALSPVEQLVASVSADRTIKLWSLAGDDTCLRTLEGHVNSVLRVQFMHRGAQLITAGSDGLLKVWGLKRKPGDECICTIDAHADRIWTMFTIQEERSASDAAMTDGPESSPPSLSSTLIVTGDASGTVKIWRDISEQVAAEALARRDQQLLQEQELSNMMLRRDFKNAAHLAMQLEQPNRLFLLLGQLVNGRPVEESLKLLSELIGVLGQEARSKLLTWLRDWNSSLKRSYISQLVLHTLLRSGTLWSSTDKQVLQQIRSYNERHFEKLDNLVINSYLIDFVVNKIK